jgi:hypothetical protein
MILNKYPQEGETFVNYEGHAYNLTNGVKMPNGKIYLTLDSYRTLVITPTENEDLVDAYVDYTG